MKKTQFLAVGLLTGMGLLAGCNDFGDMNVNPNAAATPVTSALLTNAIVGIPSTAQTGALIGGVAGRQTTLAPEPRLFVQYWSESQYPENSLYATTFLDWSTNYAVTLQDLQTVIDQNTNETTRTYAAQFGSNNNQLAIARILRAWTFMCVTDRYGDVPYFNALKRQTQVTYDPQQAIYADLLKELREAGAQFDAGRAAQGDIIYAGNATKWKKFANSLRMILALRHSKADPAKGRTEFAAAYTDAAGYIATNADNAQINYTDVNQFRNPDNALFDGRSDYGVSNVLVDKLKALNDPRLAVYAQPTDDGTYVGIPYGLNRDTLTRFIERNEYYSAPGAKVIAKTQPSYLITAAQVQLAIAEAATLGWITADAIAAYNAGIRASMEQWGVYDATRFAAYTARPDVVATAGTLLARIGEQRWIALYPNGQEAWSEWRRTGYPELKPTPYAINKSKQIPRRYAYPSTEPQQNANAYKEAVGRLQGGDETATRVWWDRP